VCHTFVMKYSDKKNRKAVGSFDWQAQGRPEVNPFSAGQETFSAGIFMWKLRPAKKDGQPRYKKGPIVLRVKGYAADPSKDLFVSYTVGKVLRVDMEKGEVVLQKILRCVVADRQGLQDT
jgi:hypothetical protein